MDKKRDYSLESLIDLDGFIAEFGDGYWVKFEVKRVNQDETKPTESSTR